MSLLMRLLLILATTIACKTIKDKSGNLQGAKGTETYYCEIVVGNASQLAYGTTQDYKVDIILTGDSSEQSQADTCQLACTAAKQKFCTDNEEIKEATPSDHKDIFVALWLTSNYANKPEDCSADKVVYENPDYKGLGYNCSGHKCALKFGNAIGDEPPTSFSELKNWCNSDNTKD